MSKQSDLVSVSQGSVNSTSASPIVISRNGGTDANTSVQYKQATTSWYAGVNASNNFGFKYDSADLATPLVTITSSGTVSATAFSGDGSNLTGISGGLGYDQSWTNVTSSRSENTTYTNSTGKPIVVNIESSTASDTTTDTTTIDATVGSATFTVSYHLSEDDGRTVRSRTAGNFIVPSGSTYSVDVTGNTVAAWYELR